MLGNCIGHAHAEDHVSALGGTILIHVLPFFLVRIFLGFGPRYARSEIERARIGRPGEGVDLLFSLGHRECLSAVARDQVELRGFVVFVLILVVI